MKWISSIIFVLSIVLLGIVGGIAGSEINKEYNVIDVLLYHTETGMKNLNNTTANEIIDKCNKERRIDKELECVRTEIKDFYYYRIRNDSEEITFNELFLEGGDCGNWAQFWEYVGERLGYEIDPIRISVNETTAHRFSILSNEQGYCKTDQTHVDCFIYG